MSTPDHEGGDERLGRLVDHVVQLASGDLGARLEPSPDGDRIDAVIVGLNMLAEELQWLNSDLERRVDERTRQLQVAQQQLRRLALYDSLTGLANRTLLAERIEQAVSRADEGAAPPAVLVLDLDGFKSVNDSFGHATGDLLLVEVARRLRDVVPEPGTVARLGGDEFAVVIADAAPEQVLEAAERVRAALQTPLDVAGRSCWVDVSIGVRLGTGCRDAGTLLRDADTAMYAAKALGRGAVRVYHPAMHAAALSRVRIAEELRTAISSGQLVLHYQPIVELESGRTSGAEALVRWQHPQRGLLAPEEFIPVAEDTGLIVDLDRWVLEAAAAQLVHWRRTALGGAPFVLHVNMSPLGLRAPGLAEQVLACLARHGVPAEDLMLEVTETRMTGEDAQTLQAMEALRSAGVGLAIDDFGAGYSSIGYVRRLFVDVVKIDRSLVTGLDVDPQQHRVAAAILAVVDAFRLAPIAEGVENQAQAAALAGLGCRYGQGSLWGAAGPADETVERLHVSLR